MDRRRQSRAAASGNVRIVVDGETSWCAIRNLSSSGCMVEAATCPSRVGSDVELVLLPNYRVTGQVAWQLGESTGIFFPQPIPEFLVRHFALDDWLLRSEWSAHAATSSRKG